MPVNVMLQISIGVVVACFVSVMAMDATGHRPRIPWLQREQMIGLVSLLAFIPMAVIMTAGASPQLNWSTTVRLGVLLWFLVMWLVFILAILPFDKPSSFHRS